MASFIIEAEVLMDKFALYHVGLEGCNGIAFFTTRRLIDGVDSINAADVILLDETHPTEYDQMICGSCEKPIYSSELEYRDTSAGQIDKDS